jgi:aryl-alcohol dehydrogenase-like predicted oxidoreductase
VELDRLRRATTVRAPSECALPCLGAMNFGRRTPAPESKRILARALERGITVIDTANAYVDGESERIVGDVIAPRRDRVVLATKCGFGRIDGRPEGLSPARLHEAVHESLRRLNTEWIDIYYLHVPDRTTPIDATLDAVATLIDQKKIRAWGISNYAAWQVLEMMHLTQSDPLRARGLPRPAIAQQLYNVLFRQLDIEWFSFARRYELHTTVYNPLAGGLLSGKHARDGSTQRGSRFDKNRLYQGRYFTDAMFDRVDALSALAKTEGLSLVELSYAWLSRAPGVDSILLGPASVAHLDEGLDACEKDVSPELTQRLDELHRTWQGTDTAYVRQ